ncbi:MAG: type II toxin-antitoxin system Phd/YefM family antitoxin [Lautropia sp.]|nr:type II toxin-antitoxin system Phd/YefM family antitoxin [Lautropia sp.]
MSSTLSIADFRRNLPATIQRAEGGEAIRISRHGRPVAVVISHEEYERLKKERPPIGEILDAWQRRSRAAGLPDDDEPFRNLRDHVERPLPELG